ncbi:unnamed protein product (macronuclear) [Paramecium tetraurelia]|uniref:PAZ and PIWI domain protein n=1 Tax=Paramecium tetraurelia TaxID=5888 RepID=A0CB11_PARTE|nr:uncharacterized protein GSPATT00036761001 [Paramecium tetraurelia]CAK67978.1 unnamed protein product [Paramecium tetraurelia]|eukprot:XP_001435375.1 hypothetical protein (macronuclear) [Paramecium tetraurelia strain d4-2]
MQKISDLPKRPARSQRLEQISRRINLISNHFPIKFIQQNQAINIYSVDFDPPIADDARKLREEIVKLATRDLQTQRLEEFTLRGRNIWSSINIQDRLIATVTFQGQEYRVLVEHKKEYTLQDLSETTVNPVTQSINVAVKRSLREMGMIEIGRQSKFYDPRDIDCNRHGLKVWRGVKTSFQMYQGKPYLQIDFASRVLRDQTALQFMMSLNTRNIQDIQNEMIGLSVLAAYGNCRIYKIDEIDFTVSPLHSFQLQDGKSITYQEYYKQRYNIQIRDLQQPLIVNRDKRNQDKIIYLVPELLTMTGLTDRQRSDYRCMQSVAQYTKLTPQQRDNEIYGFYQNLRKYLNKQNIQLSDDQNVGGFQLQAPRIFMGNKEYQTDQSGFFMIKDPVFQGSHIRDWFMVYQSRGKNDDDDVDFLVSELQKQGDRIGIRIEKPYYVVLKDNNIQNWMQRLTAEIGDKPPQLIVTFINEKDKDRIYGQMKKYCFQEHGISHQNILSKFLKSKNPSSVASKIAQQMSMKLGNPLWAIPKPNGISDKTMVIGIDIYHKLLTNRRSCMGFVAYLESECLNTFARPIIMKEGQEMCHEVGRITVEAISAYFERNGKKYLPDTIIVFRDGVGNAQIEALKQTEILQMKNAIRSINKNYNPQFAVIMINKKINDRFFMVNGGGGQNQQKQTLSNPPSGSVIADKITSSNFDYFITAQYVTQGTCTPTHYRVLENDTNWSEELFWQFTYYQCFNYQNWTGAVRVPSCVQYAHKLAYLIGDTYQGTLHKRLAHLQCCL